jgi:hypothetical protein
VPELEEADGDVAAQGVDIAGRQGVRGLGTYQETMDVLRRETYFPFDGLVANNVDAVGAVDAIAVESGVVEEDAAEVIGQGNVGIEMETPAVILEAAEAGVDGCAFVEVAPVL